MPVYLSGPELGKTLLATKPVREFTIARNGALLACGWSRYATMDQYMHQFAAPLSSLPAHGIYSFYDPIRPEQTIIVEGELEALCERCDETLETCSCSF